MGDNSRTSNERSKMAILRLLYRRFNLVAAILFFTALWVLYLIISMPAASDHKYVNSVLPHVDMDQYAKPSVTRKVTAGDLDKEGDKLRSSKDIVPPPPPDEKIIPDNKQPAIPKPPAVDIEVNPDKVPEGEKKSPEIKDEKKDEHKESPVEIEGEKKPDVKVEGKETVNNETKMMIDNVNSNTNNLTKVNKTLEVKNITKGPVLKVVENKMIEIGAKMKNKTMDEWQSVKNKTLEKLTDLGVIQKPKYIKLIYRPVKWNLNVSLENIGYIMKDTEFLMKKQNLTEMEYQPLLAPNSTLRINIANSSYGLGFCDCDEFSCVCCVRMFNKWLGLNSTACSKITFESKSQELVFEYSVDKYPIFSEKIAAEFPPKICMESTAKVVGACVLFANVTSKVAVDNEHHKLHLSGCMEFDLTLYNKTVSAFPVGCFQIPNTLVTHEDDNAKLGNFMP